MKSVVLLSHCILNPHSKILGDKEMEEDIVDLYRFLVEHDVGIIQMPCSEFTYYGRNRWGQVREQYDHPYYRESIRNGMREYVMNLKEYADKGIPILGVIGIDGSPTCGVNFSCSAKAWGGEIGSRENLDEIKAELSYVKLPGIYMEELQDIFEREGLEIDFFGYRRGTKEGLKRLLSDLNEKLNKLAR